MIISVHLFLLKYDITMSLVNACLISKNACSWPSVHLNNAFLVVRALRGFVKSIKFGMNLAQ